jgi:hypothetical protein
MSEFERANNAAKMEATRPPFHKGDVVTWHETGITDKTGTVRSIKYSRITNWWLDIEDADGITWSVPDRFVVTQ